ncbi:ATP-dependent Clp protease proteolytic subunit [Aquimarina muelleri]|uniref:Clp protease ClpP n=1 Tax=Aquimarina muelleri TaxID=279356 RepID=UPI003F688096
MKSQKRIIIIGSAIPENKTRPLQLTAESKDGKAYIRIIGRIANWNANNSNDFQKKIDELLKTHTEADVYINTMGGDVFEAIEMNNVLKGFEKVIITVGALAASSGTFFTSSYYTKVYPTTQLMIHKPSVGGGGNEDELANKLKLAQNATKKLVDIYSKKTGKTKKQIETLLNSGDYWMSAEEALKEGFVDEIIKEEGQVSAEDVTILEACGAPILPKATIQKTNQKQEQIMNREELIAFLGLEANATDAEIKAAQKAMKVDALKQRQADADAADVEANADAKKVETLVNKGVADKKFTADEAPTYTELATANYEATEKAINAMPSKPKLSADLNGGKGGDNTIEASRKDWTLDDYLEKDPEAYEKMKSEKPEQAEALEAAYFGDK